MQVCFYSSLGLLCGLGQAEAGVCPEGLDPSGLGGPSMDTSVLTALSYGGDI